MNDSPTLTIKNVTSEGNTFYVAAVWVELIWPESKGCFVRYGGLDGGGCDIFDGTVYVMNASGKTIDVLTLGQIAPAKQAA